MNRSHAFRSISATMTAFALALTVLIGIVPTTVAADEPSNVCEDAVGLRLRARHDRWSSHLLDWDVKILVQALREAYECRRRVNHEPEDWAYATLLASNINLDVAFKFGLYAQYEATYGGNDADMLRRRFSSDKSQALSLLKDADDLLKEIADARQRGFDLGDFDMSLVNDNRRSIADSEHDIGSFTYGRHTVYQVRHAREVARKTAPRGTDEKPDEQTYPGDTATPTPPPDPTPEPDETPPG